MLTFFNQKNKITLNGLQKNCNHLHHFNRFDFFPIFRMDFPEYDARNSTCLITRFFLSYRDSVDCFSDNIYCFQVLC